IQIIKPRALPDPNQVRQASGTGPPQGWICAEGTAGDDPQLGPPLRIFGKIIPTDQTPNEVIPGDATEGRVTGNSWCIKRGLPIPNRSDIPNALCGPAGSPVQNNFALWVVYQGSPPHVEPRNRLFNGVCATDTDCGSTSDCNPTIVEDVQAGASV